LRGLDLNQRPLGYEPNELPDCSTPHFDTNNHALHGQLSQRESVRSPDIPSAVKLGCARENPRGCANLGTNAHLQLQQEACMGIFGNKDEKKPDFSDVESGSSSTAKSDVSAKPDFSDVKSGSSSTAGGGDRLYIVRSGDSLSKIAQREYGDAKKWQRIFEANKDKIKDPDLIHPGQELKIPA
jgi:hypothetical protein